MELEGWVIVQIYFVEKCKCSSALYMFGICSLLRPLSLFLSDTHLNIELKVMHRSWNEWKLFLPYFIALIRPILMNTKRHLCNSTLGFNQGFEFFTTYFFIKKDCNISTCVENSLIHNRRILEFDVKYGFNE